MRVHANAIEGYWDALFTKATPALAGLLARLSPEQVEEFFASLEERNAEKQRQRGAHTTDVGRSIHSCPVARTADLEFFGTARDSTELTCDLCKTRGVMMYERS